MWIDNILNSSIIVWLLLLLFGVGIYLKKTGQTLPELIQRLKEAFNSLNEDKDGK